MTKRYGEQLSLDFSVRGSQLRLLRVARLPSPELTSEQTMLAVLRYIDDRLGLNIRWHLKCQEIADGVKVSKATAFRAIAALQDLEILAVDRSPRGMWFAIDWERLKLVTTLMQTAADTSAVLFALKNPESEKRILEIPESETQIQGAWKSETCQVSRKKQQVSAHGDHCECAWCALVSAHGAHSIVAPLQSAQETSPYPLDPWKPVEEELLRLQIGTAAECVAACKARQESPDDARAAIALFIESQSLKTFSGAGALVWRLQRGVWPAPPKRKISAAKKRSDQQREFLLAARAAESQRAELGRLEESFGSAVDALTKEECLELLPTAFSRESFLRRGRQAVRIELLRALWSRAVD